MLWFEFAVVLACIYFGARLGGLGLGTVAGFGLAFLVFGLRRPPGAMPVDVLLIIVAVVTAAAALQSAGGLTFMVTVAEKVLSVRPAAITYVAPIVTWLFTFFAGTGHVAYALLPVIAETARKAGVRPERPMSVSVIASQQAITASPISAATAGMIALFAANSLELGLIQILMICIPSTLVGSMVAALVVSRKGAALEKDPIYLERLAEGLIDEVEVGTVQSPEELRGAKLSVAIFLAAAIGVVFLGLLDGARPVTGWRTTVSIASAIQSEGEIVAYAQDLTTGEVSVREISPLAGRAGYAEIPGLDANTGIVQIDQDAPEREAFRAQLQARNPEGIAQRVAAGDLEVREPSATRVGMAPTIEVLMLAAAGLIMIFCGTHVETMVGGSVARAGVVAVVSIMGIAWLGSTFFENNSAVIIGSLSETVQRMPWTFSIALFVLSVLLYSQAATVAALMGVGLQLGIEPIYLIAMFPAVNGYFFLPTYGTILAAIEFDQTGTTRIGRYVLNHSFMVPGLVAVTVSVGVGFLLTNLV